MAEAKLRPLQKIQLLTYAINYFCTELSELQDEQRFLVVMTNEGVGKKIMSELVHDMSEILEETVEQLIPVYEHVADFMNNRDMCGMDSGVFHEAMRLVYLREWEAKNG